MKPEEVVIVINEQSPFLGRIGFLVEFYKEHEKWIVQFFEGRFLFSENEIKRVEEKDGNTNW